jgi:hypothetical protein
MCLGVFVNWLSAGLLAFTIFFYAVVYTCMAQAPYGSKYRDWWCRWGFSTGRRLGSRNWHRWMCFLF